MSNAKYTESSVTKLLEQLNIYKKEITDLRHQIQTLEAENARLKNKTKHNARNAGRKKYNDTFIESFSRFCELYESHKLINEIMNTMDISRTTYYRYKKLYDESIV